MSSPSGWAAATTPAKASATPRQARGSPTSDVSLSVMLPATTVPVPEGLLRRSTLLKNALGDALEFDEVCPEPGLGEGWIYEVERNREIERGRRI